MLLIHFRTLVCGKASILIAIGTMETATANDRNRWLTVCLTLVARQFCTTPLKHGNPTGLSRSSVTKVEKTQGAFGIIPCFDSVVQLERVI